MDNEVYDVRVSSGTLKKLQGWRSGSMTVGGPSVGDYQRIGSRRYGYFYGGSGKNSLEVVDLHIQPTTDNVTDMLHGYIRQGTHHHPHATMDCATPSLSQITEQNDDIVVETLQQPPETTLQPQSSSSTTSSSLPPMLEHNTRNKNVIQRSLEVL